MELTVEAALKLAPFDRTRVLAGRSGLGNVIRSVNVMEVPDIDDFLRPKELLLTTFFPLRNNPDAMRRLIPTLVAHDVAAIAIKLNRYVHEIPDEVIETADRLGLPILELPPDAALSDYINPLLSEMLNRQAVMLKRSEEIHTNFTRVLLGGGGVRGLAQATAEFTGYAVALYDRDQPLASTANTPLKHHPSVDWLHNQAQSQTEAGGVAYTPHLPGVGPLLAVEPALVGWGTAGYVTLWGEGGLDEIDRLAVQHAAMVLGLELQRQESVKEIEQRHTAQLLSEFLEVGRSDPSEVLRRATAIGLPLQRTDGLLTIYVDGANIQAEPGWRARLGGHLQTMRQLYATIVGVCRAERLVHILFEHDGCYQLLVEPSDRTNIEKVTRQLKTLAERIAEAIKEAFPRLDPVIGIGRYYGDLFRLIDSFQEARRALAVGKKFRMPVIHYDDLGIFRLLVATDDMELWRFVTDALNPLITYDQESNSEMVSTLAKYLETGRNVKQTAQELHVHYNTVRYRIERIEQLLGYGLDDPERSLVLHVGVKAWALMGGSHLPAHS